MKVKISDAPNGNPKPPASPLQVTLPNELEGWKRRGRNYGIFKYKALFVSLFIQQGSINYMR
jgi:hypothetical protein